MTSPLQQQPQSGPSTQVNQATPSSSPQQQGDSKGGCRVDFAYPLLVAILTFFLTVGVQWALGPHDEGIITQKMNQEVQIAMTHIGPLSEIYDAQAVVMDAGCQTPGQGVVWSGLTQIMSRYSSLGQFTSLDHVDSQISWVPNSFLATKAYVSAKTIGGTTSGPIHGNEYWTFAKIKGSWFITSFTYNLCY